MPDREKVIKAIDICLGHGKCDDCGYRIKGGYSTMDCRKPMMRDALAMLKEQDAVVLCKDCRHCTFSDGEQLADCMIKQGWFPVKPDWFCADGECKEGR